MASNNGYLRSDVDKGEVSPDKDLRLRSDADKVSGITTYEVTKDADARIKRLGLSVTKDSDARILDTFVVTKDSGARILGVKTVTKDADARIKREGLSVTKDTDSRIKREGSSVTKDVNALIVATKTVTKDVDALILKEGVITKDVDGRIKRLGLTVTKDVNALIVATRTVTKDSDARIIGTDSVTKDADALILKVGSVTKDVNANIRAPWYDANWACRKEITIDGSKVTGTLTDFTALIYRATDGDLASSTQTGGIDIVFTKSDGVTKLPHEIDEFDDATGELWAWVKTDLANGTDTIIYMYFNNTVCSDQQDKDNTWDTNYKLVAHLDDSDYSDSSGYGYHGSNVGMDDVTGKIGYGKYSDGSNNWIDFGDHDAHSFGDGVDDYPLTFSLWYRVGEEGTLQYFFQKFYTTTQHEWILNQFADGSFVVYLYSENGTGASIRAESVPGLLEIADGWQLLHVTYDGSKDHTKIKLYIDGVNVTDSTSEGGTYVAMDNGTSTVRAALYSIAAYMDEIRIQARELTADWIATEFTNQNDPAAFLDNVGTKECISFIVTKDVDAKILKVGSVTKDCDAKIEAPTVTYEVEKDSDARIKKEGLTVTKDVDARIVLTKSVTKDVDSRIIGTVAVTKDVDGRIKRFGLSVTKDADARIVLTSEVEKDVDARIKSEGLSVTKDVDALILKVGSVTKDSDAKIQAPRETKEVTKDSDARILNTYSVTKDVDGRIKKEGSVTKDVTARIVLTKSVTKDADGRIIATISIQKDVDGRIKREGLLVTKDSNALIVAIKTVTKDVDGRIKREGTIITKDVDGRILAVKSITKDVDAKIIKLGSVTKDVNARIYGTAQVTKSCDAQIRTSTMGQKVYKTCDATIMPSDWPHIEEAYRGRDDIAMDIMRGKQGEGSILRGRDTYETDELRGRFER